MSQIRIFLLTMLGIFLLQPALAQQCQMNFDEKSGLFSVKANSREVVRTLYSFWEGGWRWAGAKTVTGIMADKSYRFDVDVNALGLVMSGVATNTGSNQIDWDFDILAQEDRQDIIGGGIVFHLDLSQGDNVSVELLPDNTGWTVKGLQGCEDITVKFSKPIARVYKERGNANQIRAFFFDRRIETGSYPVKMSVILPDDASVEQTITEQLGGEPGLDWHMDLIDPELSPVDLSFLNKDEIPAGKRGYLRPQGEDLVFEDGTKARFWGVNVQAYAIFSSNDDKIRAHAKRLSKMGFNLVRLHHHDSRWVNPNIFGFREDNTLSFDKESFRKIDLWIKALKDEGIYVWLDLAVGREYSAKDGIRNFAEISKGRERTDAKGFNYIDDDVEALMKAFNEEYLNHVNEYTGLAYKDDPAIISVLITNENDLTHHFGNALLPDKNVPISNRKYMSLARQFAIDNNLSPNQTWRSWIHGPSKIFLNDLENQFNERMIEHLNSLGVKNNVVTTNSWGNMPISSLPSLTRGDIVDAHAYGRPDFLRSNPRSKGTFAHWIGAAQVAGKPFTTSEWNVEKLPDTFDRFATPVYMAALSALQGWDGIMQYGYSQLSLNQTGLTDNYSSFNDPALMALMPASALLYRQGHVAAANRTYALSLSANDFFGKSTSPGSSATIRTLMEQSKLVVDIPEVKELPWLEDTQVEASTTKIADTNRDFIPPGQDFVTSDTGELTRHWRDGTYTVNTPKSQIAMGWLGGKEITLDNISVEFENRITAAAVQSLDDQPIENAEDILISLASRTEPASANRLPYFSEPLNGTLKIKAKSGLMLYKFDLQGQTSAMPFEYQNGEYIIDFTKDLDSYWYALRKNSEG